MEAVDEFGIVLVPCAKIMSSMEFSRVFLVLCLLIQCLFGWILCDVVTLCYCDLLVVAV